MTLERMDVIPVKFNNVVVGEAKVNSDGSAEISFEGTLPEALERAIKGGVVQSFSIGPNYPPSSE